MWCVRRLSSLSRAACAAPSRSVAEHFPSRRDAEHQTALDRSCQVTTAPCVARRRVPLAGLLGGDPVSTDRYACTSDDPSWDDRAAAGGALLDGASPQRESEQGELGKRLPVSRTQPLRKNCRARRGLAWRVGGRTARPEICLLACMHATRPHPHRTCAQINVC